MLTFAKNKEQLENPIVTVNIITGESFSRLNEVWEQERCKPSSLYKRETLKKKPRKVKAGEKRLSEIEIEITTRLKKLSKDGRAPMAHEDQNLYQKANAHMGWGYYIKLAGLKPHVVQAQGES